MKVLVFLEIGADVRIPPERDPRSGRVREEWLVRELDPAGARALDVALELRAARPGTEVTAVHLGPASADPWLRQTLARGCDRAMRVWDDEATGVHAAGKAVILAAAAQASGYDLILTGAAGVLDGSGQLGVLLGARLGVPCVTQVVEIVSAAGTGGGDTVEVVRGLDRGYRERVEVKLPVVVTVAPGAPTGEAPAPADIPANTLLAAQAREIPVWDLADLGVPFDHIRRADQTLQHGRPRAPRPRLHAIAAPDTSLPAFDRILKLVEGSLQRREGRVVRKPAEEIVEEVFQTLKTEGWLDHLHSAPRQ